jgi:2'-5' RNA ligase
MRCFIAIDIGEKTRASLADLQKRLAAKVDIRKGDVKWVEPENIHLTLKFLGEIKDEQAAEVCDIAKQVAAGYAGFDITFESVGTFGGKSARVVWVGIAQGSDKLAELQKELDGRLAQAGFPAEDREFSPHLTICRVRNPKAGFKLAEAAKQFERFKLGNITADAVCVYQSQLTPAGPVYTLLGKFGLKQGE